MLGNLYNQILYQPIYNFLVFLYNNIPGHDLGIVIIILTLLIRVILFPLSQKSIKSQMKMAKHKDQIKEIQNKFKTKEEQSRELMKFYKENKINPFSGCLPLLIQLPIIIALYRVFINVLGAKDGLISPMFLGIIDLSQKSPILAILAGVSQFFASKMTLKRTISMPQPGVSDKAAETQKSMTRSMTYIFPVMTIFIAWNLPAGLAFYWVVSTLLGLA
ncbi:MAG: YidC/Oxa1 family membrane protein insertase, partial [Candidatus Portnoybacteria bacterium]|nr:YidC/Oxa1 family membrane protein insertase [Candidatus Portnoybacteria bacterium]